MFRLKESIHIHAPVDRCFLISTNLELVQRILGMRPVEGKTTGLIVADDRILWRGWKFGLPALHETLITGYSRPDFFQDTMGRGRFAFFQHDHRFSQIGDRTTLQDIVRFSLPFGPLGRLVGRYILVPYILRLMQNRFESIRRIAEGPDWQRYVTDPARPEIVPASALKA